MAEHEQELLLRGPVEVPPVKPWAEANAAAAIERYGVLRDTKAFLESQLATINEEMTTLRLTIMDYKLGHITRMAEAEGLHLNGLPKPDLSQNKYLKPNEGG